MPTATRQRRSRYTVTLADGTKQVFLGYGIQRTRAWYEERGYKVASVVPGDYRMQERRDAVARTAVGFLVDDAERDACIADLGLTLEVRIFQTSASGGRNGAYHLRARYGDFMKDRSKDTARGGMYHHITVKAHLTPEQASRTLRHELRHAAQTEAAIRAAGARTEREQRTAWEDSRDVDRGVGYDSKSREHDANAYAASTDYAIARPRS